MRRVLFALMLVFPSLLVADAKFEWKLEEALYKQVPFITHENKVPYGQYLIMNVNFSPVKRIFQKLDKHLGGALNKKNARSEAHITVITPPEFDFTLKGVVSIQEINAIAKKMKIQNFDFTVMCVGRGHFKEMSTYYLVVRSRKLKDFRKRVFDLYKRKGGDPSKFDPELFYPHITIGYTHKDLHMGPHGVKKGLNSCWGKVTK